MDMSRCDECCAKLDGVNGDTVYVLSCEAMDLFNNDYEHLCEECMDNLNSDEEVLFLKKEKYQTIIDMKDKR